MLCYCLKCRKNAKSKNPKVVQKSGRIVVLSNWALWGSKKLRFIREQEAENILDNLGQVASMPLRLLGIYVFKTVVNQLKTISYNIK